MLSYATSALQNFHLAEEAVQNTFKLACIKIDSLMSSDKPSGWLMNALKFIIRNKRRELFYRAKEVSIEQLKIDMTDFDLPDNELNHLEYYDDHSGI